jgi:hypothetical protein
VKIKVMNGAVGSLASKHVPKSSGKYVGLHSATHSFVSGWNNIGYRQLVHLSTLSSHVKQGSSQIVQTFTALDLSFTEVSGQ